MKKTRLINILLPVIIFVSVAVSGQDESQPINITANFALGQTPPIPVSLSGFSGEALQVLEFDLYVQGFKVVPSSQAQYQISGSNDGNVVGRVAIGGKEVLARSYTGEIGRAHV